MMDSLNDLRKYSQNVKFCPPTYNGHVHRCHDDVYCHGTGVSGQNGAMQMMRAKRMSTVIGHTHTFGGIVYSTTDDTAFAVECGCLVIQEPVFIME